ncbi:MAG TPA: hypothetical protein VMZ27_15015 [Candidatus Saccharimonadales bacterium]|nr:hypothetical protein [Candidatus Saccharimonadales bacterium]
MRRLYYILFYCLVFGLAWFLDPPLVVRADYISGKDHAVRLQPTPAEDHLQGPLESTVVPLKVRQH